MNELITKLIQHNLVDGANIVLERYENGMQTIDQETFLVFFGDSFPDYSYEKLIGNHTFNWNGENLNKTGEELGYKPYFDKWQALGIL